MDETRNEAEQVKVIKFPAAFVFAVLIVVFQIVSNLLYIIYGRPVVGFMIAPAILTIVAMLLLCVGLLVRKSRALLILGLLVYLIVPLSAIYRACYGRWYTFSLEALWYFASGSLPNLAACLCYITQFVFVAVLLVFAIVAFRRETGAAKLCGYLFFIPGLLGLFYMGASLFESYLWMTTFSSFLQAFLEVPMLFLLGWWLTHPYKKPKPQPQYYAPVQNTYAPGGAYQPEGAAPNAAPQAAPAKVFCVGCGKELMPGEKFCTACGQRRVAPVAPPARPQGANPQTGYAQTGYPQQASQPDVPSGGMNALSFFFPGVGLILYLVWKDQTPVKAKACGKFAIIGAIVWVGLSILLTILSALLPLIIYALF